MSFEPIEVLTLYDISSITFSEDNHKLEQEIIDKASRVLGSKKVAIFTTDRNGYIKSFCIWGFSDNTDFPMEYLNKANSNSVFIHNYDSGLFYFEHIKPISSSQLRLYRIFSKRLEDIFKRKQYQEYLKNYATHDPLTGVKNRSYFDYMVKSLGKQPDKSPLGIISCDINGLKKINEAHGYKVGDEIIRICAKYLEKVAPEHTICRLGGGEFVIIISNASEIEVNKIARTIKSEKLLYGGKVEVRMSVGMEIIEQNSPNLIEVYNKAFNKLLRDKLVKDTSSKKAIVDTLMSALKERDYITEGHVERLGLLALELGEKANLSLYQSDRLSLLAKVHDIGKVGISDSILFKPGTLTRKEWEEMKNHSLIGYRIAYSSPDLHHVAELILHHHERWDGQGYPKGLKGKDIPVECRIIAIVDAFDAMINDRPYRKGLTPEEALQELKTNSGFQFDPELVIKFESILKDKGLVTTTLAAASESAKNWSRKSIR